jgi:hypothetical protein
MRVRASRPGPAGGGATIRGAMTITPVDVAFPPAGILTISQLNQVRDALSARSRASVQFAGRAGRNYERLAVVCAGAELDGRRFAAAELDLLWEAVCSGEVDAPEPLLALLVAIGQRWESCAPELQAVQREALIALHRHGGQWALTGRAKLRTGCEVCGLAFAISRRTHTLLRRVEWGSGVFFDHPNAPGPIRFLLRGLQEQAGVGPHRRARFEVRVRVGDRDDHAPVPDGIVRYMITCSRCRRRALKRCHDEQFDGFEDRWVRCAQLAIGADYCAAHQGREPQRERRAYDWFSMPERGRRRAA